MKKLSRSSLLFLPSLNLFTLKIILKIQMGSVGLLKFALSCIEILAWPVIALGYPVLASMWAIETNSKYHMKKLVVYWTLFALISLIEFAFAKIIQWIPSWHGMKLMAIFWLVMPQFDGACLAYEGLIRPCLSVNPQAVIDWFYKPKKERVETFLDMAEKYINENGSEALEKLIASKLKPEEPYNSQRDAQVQEPEENNAIAISELLKEPDTAQKDIEKLEATEKSASTGAKQVQHAQVKETTPPEAIARNQRPETPPLNIAQSKWTCGLCQVTTTSETTLNSHLQGSKHKSKCESLKSKLCASPTSTSNQGHPETAQVKRKQVYQQQTCEKSRERVQIQVANEQAKLKRDGAANQTFKLHCDVCNVKLLSKVDLVSHLNGKRHLSNITKNGETCST